MNTVINIPIKLIILDDDPDILKLFTIMLEDRGIHNVFTFTYYVELINNVDKLPNVYLLDYNLGSSETGGYVGDLIKQKSPDSELIFMSSLLRSEDYEELINTCGASAIARKEDFDKIVFLIKRAKQNINKGMERTLDILIHSEAVLKNIREY